MDAAARAHGKRDQRGHAGRGCAERRAAILARAIRRRDPRSAIAVEANLAGFAAGFDAASRGIESKARPAFAPPEPTTENGRQLHARVLAELPVPAQAFALEGVRRLMDYQDAAYAALYLDRLAQSRRSTRTIGH